MQKETIYLKCLASIFSCCKRKIFSPMKTREINFFLIWFLCPSISSTSTEKLTLCKNISIFSHLYGIFNLCSEFRLSHLETWWKIPVQKEDFMKGLKGGGVLESQPYIKTSFINLVQTFSMSLPPIQYTWLLFLLGQNESFNIKFGLLHTQWPKRL